MHAFKVLALVAVALPFAPQAHAAASDWHHLDAGSMRLVTAGYPDAEGTLVGAIEIRLKPGWKTYWQDPGDSGVPPSITLTRGGQKMMPELGFPAPQRFNDGYANWAGYDHSVSLALTVPDASAHEGGPLTADIFIGVCETICVPVQATLSLDPVADADDADHATIVASAFAALPGPARPGFGISLADASSDKALVLDAHVPKGVTVVDLFLAGSDGMMLGAPQRRDRDNGVSFEVPAISSGGETVNYTLVTSAGAVKGTILLP